MYHKKVLQGYFLIDEYYDKRLEYMPNAQAGVNVTTYNGFVVYTLRSYTTNILTLYIHVRTGMKFLEIGCVNYSRTTRKHIEAFIKEYCPSYVTYSMLKEIYNQHENIMVVKLPDNYKEYDEEYMYTDVDFVKNILEPKLLLNEVQYDI